MISVLIITITLFFSLTAQADIDRPKVGLVLSGGGAKGFAHIGVLEVLESYNIPIDYITGTSMGALIGAMYAIGYTTEEIRDMANTTNWSLLFGDTNRRESVSLEEKIEANRFIFSVPIRNHKIELPGGLKNGQNIYRFISQLTAPARLIRNFSELPIPFACIATDIVEGKATVLNSGVLADALRATMSMPSALVSWEIDDKIYVDGGITRNLPVEEVVSMGADIVIGVDVGEPLYTKDELVSMVNILQQTIIFRAVEDTNKQRALCDVVLLPEIDAYSSVDFYKSSDLIEIGRKAAKDNSGVLKDIAKTIHSMNPVLTTVPVVKKNEKIDVTAVNIIGLNFVSENIILNKLNITTPESLTFEEIDKGVSRIFGTMFFDRITYRLDPGENGEILTIKVEESKSDQFRFGFRYDTVSKSAMILNCTFRNRFVKGSRQSYNIRLAENPSFRVAFYESSSIIPGLTHALKINGEKIDGNGSASVILNDSSFEKATYLDTKLLFLRSVSSDKGYGLGVQAHFAKVHERRMGSSGKISEYGDAIGFGYIIYDTLNRSVRPTKGSYFNLNARHFMSSNDMLNPGRKVVFDFSVGGGHAFNFNRVSLLMDYHFGAINLEQVTPDFAYFVGRSHSTQRGRFSMEGIRHYALSGSKAFVVSSGLHFEYKDNLYVQVKGYIGNARNNYEDVFDTDLIAKSAGIIIGTYSPLGPIELSLFNADGAEKENVLFSMGYFF